VRGSRFVTSRAGGTGSPVSIPDGENCAMTPNDKHPDFDPQAIGAASADDREWFEQNPRRAYRLRPVMLDEMGIEAVLRGAIVAVRQVLPGWRIRLAFVPDRVPDRAPPDNEFTAKLAFDLTVKIQGAQAHVAQIEKAAWALCGKRA
jgi:hypothetical protein